MGAGSAKGVQPEEHEDEVDSFSSSSDQWEGGDEEDNLARQQSPVHPKKTITKPQIAPKPKPAITFIDTEEPGTSLSVTETEETKDKEKTKKKTTFGFKLRRENSEKVDDLPESDDEEETRKDDKGEKGKDKKGGFRLFGWRKDEKKTEKGEEALDEDIDDLEKTFDSLGIVGKKIWGGETTALENANAKDDVILSPMRKRKNARGRVKGVNGVSGLSGGGGNSGGSNASKRTFKFSWENDKQKSPAKDETDEWEYKAVVIEGFDIEKFRKANHKESVFDSNSLPNVVGGEEEPKSTNVSSPLRYDQTEQYILASIEREFAS